MSDGGHVPTSTAGPASPMVRAAGAVGVVVSFMLIAAAGLWLHLTYYTVDRFAQPVGSDTATYLWRSRLAGALGLNAVPGSSPFEFHANSANPDRLGFPALAGVLRWTTTVGPYRLMFVLPAICAIVLGLAGFALARSMDEPRWAAAVWGLAGATSIALAVAARGYFDNVLVDPVLIAAAAALLSSMESKGPALAAVVLLIAAILAHYLIAGFMLGVFVAFGVVLLPWSLRAWRAGTPLWRTPSGRVGSVVGASALAGGIGLLATPGAHAYADRGHSGYEEKLQIQLPAYRLPLTLPVAVLGALGLAARGERARWRGLALLVVWSGVIAVGWLPFSTGRSIPVHRLFGMAFPLTFLAAAAFTSLIAFATKPKGVVRYVLGAGAWVLTAVALVASAQLGRNGLGGVPPMWSAQDAAVARTAVDYLQGAQVDGPVIVVANHGTAAVDFGGVPAFRRMRGVMPGAQIPNLAVYVGDPEQLLAGEPTVDSSNPALTATSKLYWDHLGGFVGPDTIVMVVQPFDSRYNALAKAHPGWVVAPGVLVARGPPAPAGLRLAPLPVAPASGDLIRWTLWPLLLFLVCGIGWAVSFVPQGWAERTAMAPALGLAAIILVAYAGGMAGVALHGGAPRAMAVVAAVIGWIPAAGRAFRRRAKREVTPVGASVG